MLKAMIARLIAAAVLITPGDTADERGRGPSSRGVLDLSTLGGRGA